MNDEPVQGEVVCEAHAGPYCQGVCVTCLINEVERLQQLMSPLPGDLEAELRAVCVDFCDGSKPDGEMLASRIRPLLARAAGREDDGEPVTATWLVRSGFWYCDLEEGWILTLRHNPVGAGISCKLQVGLRGSVDGGAQLLEYVGNSVCGRVSVPISTRGDVRRLCKALGVPLTEAT